MRRLIPWPALALALLGCDPGYEVCTTHYPSGEVWSVRYYDEGLPHRPWIAWYSSDVPRLQTYYDHGARVGTWRTVGADGTVLFEREYLDDEPHGTCRRFHANGHPASVRHFERGRPVGSWTFHDEQGALLRREEHGAAGGSGG